MLKIEVPLFNNMLVTSDKIPEGAGTIEDMIVRARQKFSDVDMQAKYVKIAVGLLKRDHEDVFKICNFIYSGYEGVTTMWPSGGKIYAHWELYESGALEASGVEKYSSDTNQFQLLFTTSSELNKPILPQIMNR